MYDHDADADAMHYEPAPTLADCQCGCNGDYTDHSMRAGESGRSPSVIIR